MRLRGQWHLESGWHPSPQLRTESRAADWHGCCPFPQEAPPRALQPGSQLAASAFPAQPGPGPQASSGTSLGPGHASPHPGVLCPGGSRPALASSSHTHRPTAQISSPAPKSFRASVCSSVKRTQNSTACRAARRMEGVCGHRASQFGPRGPGALQAAPAWSLGAHLRSREGLPGPRLLALCPSILGGLS